MYIVCVRNCSLQLLTKAELDFFMTITNEGNAVDDNVSSPT